MIHNVSIEEMEEIQLIQAMFMDECELITSKSKNVLGEIRIKLTPNTAMNDTNAFVRCTLKLVLLPKVRSSNLHLKVKYPEETPKIELIECKGMYDEQIKAIENQLIKKARTLLCSPMIFELTELAKELLTQNNVPKTDCIICLCPFEEEDSPEVFMKTHCYHYFHRSCLAEWCFRCELTIAEKKEEIKNNMALQEKQKEQLEIICPSCRMPLTSEDIDLLEPHLFELRREKEEQDRQKRIEEERQRWLLEQEQRKFQQQMEKQQEETAASEPTSGTNSPGTARNTVSPIIKVTGVNRGHTITNSILRKIFEPYGVRTTKLMYQKGKKQGFAFVEFETLEQAQEAIAKINNTEVNGQLMECKLLSDCEEENPEGNGTNNVNNNNSTNTGNSIVIIVSGLTPKTNTKELRNLFEAFEATNCQLLYQHGRHKGIAKVEFQTTEAAQAAILVMHGTVLNDRSISCCLATPKDLKDFE